jgi:predicted ABC-type ATPase
VTGAPWFVLVAGVNGAGKSTFSQDPATLIELLQLSTADSVEVLPDNKIRKRWQMSLHNLPWFWIRVQSCLLFLNPPDFGSPKLLASKQEGWTRILLTNECHHTTAALLEATAEECGLR